MKAVVWILFVVIVFAVAQGVQNTTGSSTTLNLSTTTYFNTTLGFVTTQTGYNLSDSTSTSTTTIITTTTTTATTELTTTVTTLSPLRHRTKVHRNCSNHGEYRYGKCRCQSPYTGPICADFACDHGLSVGPRYDPKSEIFNKKCICEEDWTGEFCDIPVADQCNEHGQYVFGRCICLDFYFGSRCQYVGRCVNGRLIDGRCRCEYGWSGDYCDRIVCHHGYTSAELEYATCVCPPRHRGQFCDECVLQGSNVIPFPNCTEEHVPSHANMSREKTDSLLFTRVTVIAVVFVILIIVMSIMWVLRWGRSRTRSKRPVSVNFREPLTDAFIPDIEDIILKEIIRPKRSMITIRRDMSRELGYTE